MGKIWDFFFGDYSKKAEDDGKVVVVAEPPYYDYFPAQRAANTVPGWAPIGGKVAVKVEKVKTPKKVKVWTVDAKKKPSKAKTATVKAKPGSKTLGKAAPAPASKKKTATAPNKRTKK